MTTVTVTTTGGVAPKTKPIRMTLRTIDNKHVINFPIAPREVTYSNFGWVWEEVERDGTTPYLLRSSFALPTVEFTAKLAYSMEPLRSVEPLMGVLKNMAHSTTVLTMKYGGWFDARSWHITDLTFKTVQRNPTTNAPTWVEADITLTNAVGVKLTVGPVSGGKKSSSSKSSKSTKKTSSKKKTKTRKYKIRKGDTLMMLSSRFYSTPEKWRYLADINKIKNPKKLKVGSTIRY